MLYTRTGDDGTTSLFGGKRILKSDPRIEACGTIDELFSFLGLTTTQLIQSSDKKLVTEIQKDLYQIMAFLSGAKVKIDFLKKKVSGFEQVIDHVQKKLPKIHSFILPQGKKLSVLFHICRTICRRAERRVVMCFNNGTMKPYSKEILVYLNRLSDLFFILARKYNKEKFVI
jgi:cob(I)alamin adenosyltransferase